LTEVSSYGFVTDGRIIYIIRNLKIFEFTDLCFDRFEQNGLRGYGIVCTDLPGVPKLQQPKHKSENADE